ncbi:MAG TPA: hypothetical protein VF669_18265 [Tepidisphaeraceae bacterium]|jgi:hypothetical protein
MGEMTRLAEEARRNASPLINFTTPDPSAAMPAVSETTHGNSPLRPSRRKNQPDSPPTQAEIRAFLNRLRKTSFKRSSKGFKHWMQGFGVNSDAPDPHSSEQ